MSRAYRIRVRESLRRVVRARDHVRTQIELLPILPTEQMAELLAEELSKRGFERRDGKSVRQEGQVTITIDDEGNVTVSAESSQSVQVEAEKEGLVYDDAGPTRDEKADQLEKQVLAEIERKTRDRQKDLQDQLTTELEAVLGDVRTEVDRAVNAATAEALKRKAAQLGEIQEISEDSESGSLTIVVEV